MICASSVDGCYLPIELVCLYGCMIPYVLASSVWLYVLLIKRVYLHKTQVLDLSRLDDDQGLDVFSRLSTLGSWATIRGERFEESK